MNALGGLEHHVDRALVVGDAAAARHVAVDVQLERGSEPLGLVPGGLHVVVAVDQDGRRPGRAQPLSQHHRMAVGLHDPAAGEVQLRGEPLRGGAHRGGVGVPADAGHGDVLGQLAQVAGVAGLEVQCHHRPALPPSMAIVWPVTQPDASAAKNRTPLAMSSGWPSRRSAMPVDQLALPVGAVAVPLNLGRRVGQDEPRRDAVDRDPERAQLVGHLPGEADLARLGAGVGLDAGLAGAQAGGRGDVDDPALAPRLHRPPPPRGCTGTRWSGSRPRPRARPRR